MKSISLLLLSIVCLSQSLDLKRVCEVIGKQRYYLFPLANEISSRSCVSSARTCFKFSQFSSNDLAKAFDNFKDKAGCFENQPVYKTEEAVCSALRDLPNATGTGIFRTLGDHPEALKIRPLVEEMSAVVGQWIEPLLEEGC